MLSSLLLAALTVAQNPEQIPAPRTKAEPVQVQPNPPLPVRPPWGNPGGQWTIDRWGRVVPNGYYYDDWSRLAPNGYHFNRAGQLVPNNVGRPGGGWRWENGRWVWYN